MNYKLVFSFAVFIHKHCIVGVSEPYRNAPVVAWTSYRTSNFDCI